jgi:hypothetical protein
MPGQIENPILYLPFESLGEKNCEQNNGCRSEKEVQKINRGRPQFMGTSPRKLKACRDRLRIPFCTCLLKVWVRKIVSKIMAAEVKKKCKK